MLDLLGDIFFGFLELIGYGAFSSTKKTEFDENIEELNKEEWFSQLYNDFRYRHIISETWKVSRYLNKKENAQLLVNNQQERENFIRWVKDEHERITWGKKRDKGDFSKQKNP